MLNAILLGFSAVLIALGLLWLRRIPALKGKPDDSQLEATALQTQLDALQEKATILQAKRAKRSKIAAVAMVVVGDFLFLARLMDILFGQAEHDLSHISIWPDRIDLFGVSVSITVVYTWIIMAILIVAALVVRLTAFRRPNDAPSGLQNLIETIVEAIGKYTNSRAHGTGELLCSYILTITFFLVMCAFLELFRLRAPTSDITVTLALAIMTFIIINVYGIKRKGLLGRIKSLASPTPIVFPFRLISEIAIPVSLACRLFGNMLGGMIVIDLLYSALGNNAVGIPGVLGLYFNAFHPLIQTFIFITLTLTFINEAIE